MDEEPNGCVLDALHTVATPDKVCVLSLPLTGTAATDMGSLEPITRLLLCALLLASVHITSSRMPTDHPSTLYPQLSSLGFLSCQTILPQSLPGFSHLAPLPKFMVGLALRNALENMGCLAEARALQTQLYRWGGVKATRGLIQHLKELQQADRSTHSQVSTEALVSALGLLALEQTGLGRVRRALPSEICENEREQGVYSLARLLPTVGTFYNLGTALYYAAYNCSDKAHQRGQEGTLDLGYDLLMGMLGLSGGPMGLAISTALKPVIKTGVQRLIQYYYAEQEASTPWPESSIQGLGGILAMSDSEETQTPALWSSKMAD